ncbi:YhdT family protein [Oleidesulfovibrio sp.]|uniref:YhdT family protein n=1 Tax=Oleidesulfovibrio sp. TaxID=2909707 RepID=UPI003A86E242
MKKKRDQRFIQANKEAVFALGVYALYFLWWYFCAYGMGDGDPEQYNYVLGLPEWFFYSCIVGYPLITLVLWGIVRLFYKEMPLDDTTEDSSDADAEGGRS